MWSRGARVAARDSCGRGASVSRRSSVFEEHGGAEDGQTLGELPGGLLGADRRPSLEEKRSGVHPGIHLEGGDPRLALAVNDGPRDRGRAAIPREQRRVDVDRPARGHVENRLREDLAEGHDDRDVGRVLGEALGPAGITDPGGLEHRDAVLARQRLDGRGLLALPAAGGSIRLRHSGHHAVAGKQALERGKCEGGSAVEQHAHEVRL